MQSLYESDHLSVVGEDRGSATLWVTFAALEAGTAFAESFVAGRRESAVHVIPKHDHWYQVEDIWAALAAARDFAAGAQAQRIITYGSSMGAFAAIAFAKELNADLVIAAAPQVSV